MTPLSWMPHRMALHAPQCRGDAACWCGGVPRMLCDLLQLARHGGTQGMSTKKHPQNCAMPGIQNAGAIQEETYACIHLAQGDLTE